MRFQIHFGQFWDKVHTYFLFYIVVIGSETTSINLKITSRLQNFSKFDCFKIGEI